MKNKLLYAALIIGLASFLGSCAAKKKAGQASQEMNEGAPLTIKGSVTAIENGKDGYTATVLSQAKKEYQVTISKINLERRKAAYKRFEVGEKVTITGDWWKDATGKIYITASNLHILP